MFFMIKYKDSYVVFEEIPDMVSLAINITGCQNNCIGCHSPELRKDFGIELTEEQIDMLVKANYGVNCVLFMGEGRDISSLLKIAQYTREKHQIKVGVYSGRESVENEYFTVFDFVKIGSYKKEFGPLNNKTTNQKLYKCENGNILDITHLMWR